MAQAERTGPVVAYLTDVEGLWSKLVSFTDDNALVTLDGEGKLQVSPGSVFVFGGDAIDRGPGARRLVRTLLEAKRRQPDRVVLLAGNRDINKLRLRRELGGHPPRRMPDTMRGSSRPEMLRWIFGNTMGAQKAFESRRQELEAEGGDASDEGVVESFLADLGPGGDLEQYLGVCQLAYRAGATFFVHGSVTAENLGRVPGHDGQIEGVGAWEQALNGWYRDQIERYRSGEVSASGEAAWGPLVAYQAPVPGTKLNQGSVVYARPTDAEGNPLLPCEQVQRALVEDGVRRVVVGHSPVGDSPALLAGEGFEFLAADNSYSPVEAGVQVFVRDELIESRAKALLAGEVEQVRIQQRFGDRSLVGLRVASTGHLVKGELSSGDFLLHRSEPNFRVDQRTVTRHELQGMQLIEAGKA